MFTSQKLGNLHTAISSEDIEAFMHAAVKIGFIHYGTESEK
jgi:hypothetical protein